MKIKKVERNNNMEKLQEIWIKVIKTRKIEELSGDEKKLYDYTMNLQQKYDKALDAYGRMLQYSSNLEGQVVFLKSVIEESLKTLIESKEFRVAQAMELDVDMSILIKMQEMLNRYKGDNNE